MSNAAKAASPSNESNSDWVGTVKEFPEIKIPGTTKEAVLAGVKAKVKQAIEERRMAGETFPAGKMKVKVTVKKKEE